MIPLKDMTPFYESWTEGTKNWRRFRKNAQVQPPADTLIKIVDENNVTSEIPFRESQFYIERKKEKLLQKQEHILPRFYKFNSFNTTFSLSNLRNGNN